MVLRARPYFYSKKYRFATTKDNIQIERNTNFILSAKKNTKEQGDKNLRYYWKLVQGNTAQINDVSEDGSVLKMTTPDTTGIITFQLRVVDKITGEQDTDTIQFQVVE